MKFFDILLINQSKKSSIRIKDIEYENWMQRKFNKEEGKISNFFYTNGITTEIDTNTKQNRAR